MILVPMILDLDVSKHSTEVSMSNTDLEMLINCHYETVSASSIAWFQISLMCTTYC